MNKKELSKLVSEYCKKDQNKTGDYPLANKIIEEQGFDYNIFESIRQRVKYIRGHVGKNNNKYAVMPIYKPETSPANILVLDIETAPLKGFFWDIWNQNIQIGQITNDWFILTWSAKWLFEEKSYSARLTGKEAINQDDRRIMKSLWSMLDKADLVITHNGDKFDLPRINTRFVLNGLQPPQPYLSVDTLKSVRKTFAFVSNKQDYLNIKLGSPRKLDTGGQELWNKCYEGDEKALKKMEEYNIGDIYSLEENYLKLRAWIKPHPNVGLFITDELERCPSCASDNLTECGKPYMTTVNLYESLKCNNCGAYSRRRKPIKTSKQKLSSLPR